MSKRRPCKFFADGACLKGEHCEFSHDSGASPNNICSYYLKGRCYYGSQCKYEHVRPSRTQSSASSSSTIYRRKSPVSSSMPETRSVRTGINEVTLVPGGSTKVSDSKRLFTSSAKQPFNVEHGEHDLFKNGDVFDSRIVKEDRSICSFAADGNCSQGERCPLVHGDLCPTCGKHCLHPFKRAQREEHLKTCEKKQKHLEALKLSQEIECCVCLDKVLSKPTAAERKFGLLSECDHPFCISCIRNWRSSSPAPGMDGNAAVKACPVCRKTSYFVVPSVTWYSSRDEKQEIVENYKAKLRSIDCKHFNFGNGNCPFAASCFYRHHVKPGSYMWKYHEPPPRRHAPCRSNVSDVEYLHYILEQILSEDDEPEFLDYDDFTDINNHNDDFTEEISPFDMALMFSMLDYGPDGDSSDEDNYIFLE